MIHTFGGQVMNEMRKNKPQWLSAGNVWKKGEHKQTTRAGNLDSRFRCPTIIRPRRGKWPIQPWLELVLPWKVQLATNETRIFIKLDLFPGIHNSYVMYELLSEMTWRTVQMEC